MTKDVRIFVRLPTAEKEAAQAALEAQGKTISQAVRDYLRAVAAGD